MIDQKVTRHPRQPGAERALRRAERLQRPEDAQEHFLRQVLRLRAAAGEAVAQSVDPPGVQTDQFLPGGLVAAQAPRNEAVVRVQATFYQIAAPADTHHAMCEMPAAAACLENSKS